MQKMERYIIKPFIFISLSLTCGLYPANTETQTVAKSIQKGTHKDSSFQNIKSLAFSLYEKSPSKAIDFLKKYYKKYPNQKQFALLLAKMLAWSDRYQESMYILNSDLLKSDEESILMRARIEAWRGRYTQSLKLLEYIIKHSNNRKRVWEAKKLKANIYMWSGKKKKAIKIFEELKKSGFKDNEVNESLMILKGDIQPLIKKYKKILSKDPNNQELIKKLAELHHMAKENKEAIKYYTSLLKEYPNNIDTYKSRGEIYLEMKQFFKGFGDWEYYANYLHKKRSLYQLAQRYYWYGYYDAAISVLDDLKELYPNDNEIWHLRARVLKEKPRYLSNITQNSSNTQECKKNFTMAQRLYVGDFYKDSLAYYENYLKCKPDDYNAREHYAYALEKSGKFQKAASEFYLMQWMKKTPEIVYHYAYNLQKSGQIERAKEVYKQLLSTLPQDLPTFLKRFVNKWVKYQEKRKFSLYINMYDKKIRESKEWLSKNRARFEKNRFINISIKDPIVYKEDKNRYRVRFYEKYNSSSISKEGYIELLIVCDHNKCKIISEKFEKSPYKTPSKTKIIEKEIKKRLKEIKKNSLRNSKSTISSRASIAQKGIETPLKNRHGYVSRGPFGTFADKLDKSSSGKPLSSSNIQQRRYSIETAGEYFSDNNGVNMKNTGLSISYKLDNGKTLYFFTGGFYISDSLNSAKERGKFIGLGLHGSKFSADIFADNGGDNTSLGWSLAYDGDIGFTSLHASVARRNLVYSRKTADSVDLMDTKFKLSGYKVLNDLRGVWWSLEYEHIEDNNNVLTLQYDYSFYDHKLLGGDVIYYLVGWYMFNSQTNDSYYSPTKIDNTLVGIRYEHDISANLRLSINGVVGRSFIDGVNLYDGGVWLKNTAKAPYEVSLGCNFNNGTGVDSSSGYRSKECGARLTYKW